jgi:hypothetical protein
MIDDIIFDVTDYFIFETPPIVGGSSTNISYDGDNYIVNDQPEIITIVTF